MNLKDELERWTMSQGFPWNGQRQHISLAFNEVEQELVNAT